MKKILFLFSLLNFVTLYAQDNIDYTIQELTEKMNKAADENNFKLAGNYKKAVQLKKAIQQAIADEDFQKAEELKNQINGLQLSENNTDNTNNLQLSDVCPGSDAITYRDKMIAAGSNTEAAGAYGTIAAYYAYKCECEFGTNRAGELIDKMNGLVKTNESYYKNKYGTITSISTCKSLDGSQTTINSEIETTGNSQHNYYSENLKVQNAKNAQQIAKQLGLNTNQSQVLNIMATSSSFHEMGNRLKEHNIEQISDMTADGINQLLGQNSTNLPISSNDIKNMLKGNWQKALQGMQRRQNEQNANQIAKSLGLNASQSQALNIIATSGSLDEMTKRLQQQNINQLSNLLHDGVKQFLGDNSNYLPISSTDMANMLSGNWNAALLGTQLNNSLSDLGLGNMSPEAMQLTGFAIQGLMLLAEGPDTVLIFEQKMALANAEAQLEAIKEYDGIEKHRNISGNFKAEKPFVYTADFTDDNWTIKSFDFLETKNVAPNSIELNYIENADLKGLSTTDYINHYDFLSFQNEDFNIAKDFEISFEVECSKEQVLKNVLSPTEIHLFLSNYIYMTIPSPSYFGKLNTRFFYDTITVEKRFNYRLRKELYTSKISKKEDEIKKLCWTVKTLIPVSLDQTLESKLETQARKKIKMTELQSKLMAKSREDFKKYKKDKKNKSPIIRYYTFTKEGKKLSISCRLSFSEEKIILEYHHYNFKFIKENKLAFCFPRLNEWGGKKGNTLGRKGDNYIIRNFTIKQ